MSCHGYFSFYNEYESERRKKIELAQQDTGRILDEKEITPIYVTLNPESKNGEIAYKKFYLEKIFDKEIFIFYDEKDKTKTIGTLLIENQLDISNLNDLNDLYLIAYNKIPSNITENVTRKEYFLEYLVTKQIDDIKSLTYFEVISVDEINLQIYLNEYDSDIDDGYCLYMFINQQTLVHSGNKLAAFQTRKEKYVTDIFTNMIKESNI